MKNYSAMLATLRVAIHCSFPMAPLENLLIFLHLLLSAKLHNMEQKVNQYNIHILSDYLRSGRPDLQTFVCMFLLSIWCTLPATTTRYSYHCCLKLILLPVSGVSHPSLRYYCGTSTSLQGLLRFLQKLFKFF